MIIKNIKIELIKNLKNKRIKYKINFLMVKIIYRKNAKNKIKLMIIK